MWRAAVGEGTGRGLRRIRAVMAGKISSQNPGTPCRSRGCQRKAPTGCSVSAASSGAGCHVGRTV